MVPRDPAEANRAATPLELFFDLVFAIAVGQAASELRGALSAGEVLHGLTSYATAFFAVWWAWMNFSWFASSFDVDDWLYRVLTIVQMAGVLVVAAGVGAAFERSDFTIVVAGYVLMRLVMVAQWLRASRSSADHRRTAVAYASGIALLQVLWVAMLTLPVSAIRPAVAVLIFCEVTVPVVAERIGPTPWHPHHITDRYSSFTLILLGESLLASAGTIIGAHKERQAFGSLVALAVGAFLITAALWWIYFWPPHHSAVRGARAAFRYGYVHYFVFAAAGAFSAGVGVQTDLLAGTSKLSGFTASFTVTVPVALFILAIWWIALRAYARPPVNVAVPLCALLVLADPVMPVSVVLTALLCTALVVVLVLNPPGRPGPEMHEP